MSSAPDAARVACCSRSFSRHPVLARLLAERFVAPRLHLGTEILSGEALVSFLEGAERAIVGLERIDRELLDQLPALRVVSKFGVGLDRIDLAALEARDIRFAWTPGVNRRAVAELTVALALTLLRGLHLARDSVKAGAWQPRVGRELGGVTLGVLGIGNIGKELIRLVQPFGTRIVAHDLLDFPEFEATHGVTKLSLEALLREADVVSVHLPLDASTRGILSRERLGQMRAGAHLINTSRGGIVDEAALIELLDAGRLGGAALDVLADEPPLGTTLTHHPKILCTPHLGGSSEEAILSMGKAALDGLDPVGA
jgi:phosphoglycerate dehydrogenase-like enzyme